MTTDKCPKCGAAELPTKDVAFECGTKLAEHEPLVVRSVIQSTQCKLTVAERRIAELERERETSAFAAAATEADGHVEIGRWKQRATKAEWERDEAWAQAEDWKKRATAIMAERDEAREQLAAQAAEIERLRADAERFDRRGADKLAYECARAVQEGRVGSRSAIGDALLNYLEVGGMDGPRSVPEWMEKYAARKEQPQ